MSTQVLIVGLGQFGTSLARALAEQGSEVLAVDVDESRVKAVVPHVSDALTLDATDEEALQSLAPQDRGVCVCALGENSREASIMVTAMLRQLDAPHIVSRAADSLHARVLRLVGAHEVVRPEHDYGERLAMRLVWNRVLRVLPLGGEVVLTELVAPEPFWGQTLEELKLFETYGVVVAAVRADDASPETTVIPNPAKPLESGDVLLLVSTRQDAKRVSEAGR